MRSVVLEIKENKAAVLDNRGIVHAVKNRDYEVGQVLHLTELELKRDEVSVKDITNRASVIRRPALIRTAAAVLAVAIIGGGVTSYAAPVSTVTLDGASGVEYRLNIYDRVVGASATDDADESFRQEVSDFSAEIKGMEISDAIDATTGRFGNEMFGPDDVGEKPDVSIKVGGLKKKDRHLSDKMDHKRDEIKEKKWDKNTVDRNGSNVTDSAADDVKDDVKENENRNNNISEKNSANNSVNNSVKDSGAADKRPDSAGVEDDKKDMPERTDDKGADGTVSEKGSMPENTDKDNGRVKDEIKQTEPERNSKPGDGRKAEDRDGSMNMGGGEDTGRGETSPSPAGDPSMDDMGRGADSAPDDNAHMTQDIGDKAPERDIGGNGTDPGDGGRQGTPPK